MERNNYTAIDIVKFICAILVIGIHTGPLLSINEGANFLLVQGLGRIAVPFFFTASSFFFFLKIDDQLPLSDQRNLIVLKRYLSRLLKLYLVWTILYFPLVILQWFHGGFHWISVIRYFRDLFFTGSYYHLWFLPALMFATFLVYWLLQRMRKKDLLLLSFLCYLLGMLVNVYGDFLLTLPIINVIVQWYLKVFVTTRNGLFFAFIFVVIGYFLAKKKRQIPILHLRIGLFITVFLYFIEVYFLQFIGYNHDLTCMYLMLIPLIYYLFVFLLCYQDHHNTKRLRSMSTLIYVGHLYVVEIIARVPFLHANSLLYFIVVTIGSILLSYLILWVSKKNRKVKVLY